MKAAKITNGDIADMKISALPTRPTAPTEFGGKGYTASEVKEAFDKLPLYIIERYNELIDDISGTEEGSIADAIKTGVTDTHTLAELFADITSGAFAGYLAAPEGTLAEYLLKLRQDISTIAENLKITL